MSGSAPESLGFVLSATYPLGWSQAGGETSGFPSPSPSASCYQVVSIQSSSLQEVVMSTVPNESNREMGEYFMISVLS